MITSNNPTNQSSHYIKATLMSIQYSLVLELEKALNTIRVSRRQSIITPLMRNFEGFIRPIECDQLTDEISKIIEATSTMTQRIKSFNKLQEPIKTNHYELLMYLYSVHNGACKLNEQIKEFRSICMDDSAKQRRMLSEVQQEVSIVIHECDQVERCAEKLLDGILLD